MNRRYRLLAFVALLAASCGGGGDVSASPEGPEEAFQEQMEMLTRGQIGRAYERLHPAQQAILDQGQLARCLQGTSAPMDRLDVIETWPEQVVIPGTGLTVDSTAITYEADIELDGQKQTRTGTSHLVEVDGEWRWYLADPHGC